LRITTEFWPIGLKRFGIEPKEYLKLLLGQGFKLYNINEQEKRIEPVNALTLLKTCTVEKETNLLCIRKNN